MRLGKCLWMMTLVHRARKVGGLGGLVGKSINGPDLRELLVDMTLIEGVTHFERCRLARFRTPRPELTDQNIGHF